MKLSQIRNKVLIVLILLLLILSSNFLKKEVKNLFYVISSPIQKWLWKTGDSLSDFFEAISEIKSLKKENEELKLKTQELLAENVKLKELKKENEILRAALNIGLEKEFKLILAQVTEKDTPDLISIDKGLKDGVIEGMPVITQQKTLVGKIGEVFENFSKVMLISNEESSFDAKIVDSETYGRVKGEGNFKLLFDLVPKEKEIKIGDQIITSALGENFPKDLLVGEIQKVKKSDIQAFQEAEIESAFDIRDLDFLFVITNFKSFGR